MQRPDPPLAQQPSNNTSTNTNNSNIEQQHQHKHQNKNQHQHQILYPVTYIHDNKTYPGTCGQCIQCKLGQHVDIQWDIKHGFMKLRAAQSTTEAKKEQQQSQQQVQGSQKQQQQQQQGRQIHTVKYSIDRASGTETIRNVLFYHGNTCPLLDQHIAKLPHKPMKPCACVMLYDRKNHRVLITQRSPNLRTYPNSWVLPGGHLDPNQTIFEGGIRECQEEVGLHLDSPAVEPIKQSMVMLWESVFTMENQVKACAIVVFFVAFCDEFPVKVQEKQVGQYKWKDIADREGEVRYSFEKREGYAEGHLKFLEVVRAHLLKSGTKL